MKWKRFWEVVKQSAADWYGSPTFEQGAALAYYGVFAIAPILVIALAIAGMLFGQQFASTELFARIRETAGPAVADAIAQTLRYSSPSGQGWRATLVSAVLLSFASLGVFTQLQAALNTIWQVKPKPGRGVWGAVKDRFISFLLVLAIGVLLVAALVVNTLLTAISGFFPEFHLPGGAFLWHALHWAISLALLTLLIAMIYKVLPDAKIRWQDVWVGATTTAVLFAVGNYLIGLYLGRSSVTSTYGAAGSLVIVLLWVYYGSQILLFGAEFTRVYADRYGRPLEPSDNAIPMTAEECARRGMASRSGSSATAQSGS